MGRPMARGMADTLKMGPVFVDEAYQMRPGDFTVVAESTSGVDVTLPAKIEAFAGMVYSVYAPAGASGDVSVIDKEAGTEIATYGDLDADGDLIAVTLAGEVWAVVGSVLS